MTDQSESFWPTGHFDMTDPSPVVLLKNQARLVASQFDGAIKGIVRMDVDQGTIYHSLYLKVDALGDYLYKLLYIAYPAGRRPSNAYPISAQNTDGDPMVTLADDEQFRVWLRGELSSEFVRGAIGNILKYIEDRKDSSQAGAKALSHSG